MVVERFTVCSSLVVGDRLQAGGDRLWLLAIAKG